MVAVSSLGGEPGTSLVSIFRAVPSENLDNGIEWSGGSNEFIIPMKYHSNPKNATLRISLEPDLNVTLLQNVTVDLPPPPTPQFVVSTSLSNADAIAIAASDTPDSLAIEVHYYQYNGSEWEEYGTRVEVSRSRCSEFEAEEMVQLSADGRVLVVSDGTNVTIYEWDDDGHDWSHRGEPIQQSEECSIRAVSLSASGNEVAVHALYEDVDGEEVSSVFTYNWSSDFEWKRRERRNDSVHVESGNNRIRLALSENGRELAIGRPYFPADHSGRVQTYEFPRTECDEGFERFRITMTIQPTITKWKLVSMSSSHNNDTMFFTSGGGPYFFPNFPGAENVSLTHHAGATVVEELCIPYDKFILRLYPTRP
jgi:hypothetical protein